jgi:hypothetical protein
VRCSPNPQQFPRSIAGLNSNELTLSDLYVALVERQLVRLAAINMLSDYELLSHRRLNKAGLVHDSRCLAEGNAYRSGNVSINLVL